MRVQPNRNWKQGSRNIDWLNAGKLQFTTYTLNLNLLADTTKLTRFFQTTIRAKKRFLHKRSKSKSTINHNRTDTPQHLPRHTTLNEPLEIDHTSVRRQKRIRHAYHIRLQPEPKMKLSFEENWLAQGLSISVNDTAMPTQHRARHNTFHRTTRSNEDNFAILTPGAPRNWWQSHANARNTKPRRQKRIRNAYHARERATKSRTGEELGAGLLECRCAPQVHNANTVTRRLSISWVSHQHLRYVTSISHEYRTGID